MKHYFPVISLLGLLLLCSACGEKTESNTPHFTKADSLMDTYLGLQDSMLQVWNMMISDDNRKIHDMQNLVHEIRVSGSADPATLDAYETRLKPESNVSSW